MTPEQAKQIRLQLGLTQQQMASKIGVVWQSISGYENGNSIPEPIENLYKLINKHEVKCTCNKNKRGQDNEI